MKGPDRILLALRVERVTSCTLRRRHSIFKTWLEPVTRVEDDRDRLDLPLRAALARAGLSNAAITRSGEDYVEGTQYATSAVGTSLR